MAHVLSKSRFQSGCQCLRRLWLEVHRPELAAPVDPVTQARFQAGSRVGEIARERFPGGVLVTARHYHHGRAVVQTRELLDDGGVPAVFEGGFLFDDVRVRVDILARAKEGGWRLIEVKSSTRLKDEHLTDLAIQQHVLRGSGVEAESSGLMHINSGYIYDGARLDPAQLMSVTDASRQVNRLLHRIPGLLDAQKAVLRQADEPDIAPGFQCSDPYECGFIPHCTAAKPKHWIMRLPRLRREQFDDLTVLGIEDIADIPDDYPLSPQQARAHRAVRTGETWVCSNPAAALADVEHPIHFLDFETISTAIPRYPGTRPYEVIPFQWSLHTLEGDGRLAHAHYLCEEDRDPRRELAEALLRAVGKRGTILGYHAQYESGIIRRLAEELPDLQLALEPLLARVVDLLDLVKRCYYHPDFLGSYSLKQVLPVMAPDAVYDDLAIQEGNLASVEYLNMLSETDPQKRAQLKSDLLAYCERDTWAMVRIWQELRALGS